MNSCVTNSKRDRIQACKRGCAGSSSCYYLWLTWSGGENKLKNQYQGRIFITPPCFIAAVIFRRAWFSGTGVTRACFVGIAPSGAVKHSLLSGVAVMEWSYLWLKDFLGRSKHGVWSCLIAQKFIELECSSWNFVEPVLYLLTTIETCLNRINLAWL